LLPDIRRRRLYVIAKLRYVMIEVTEIGKGSGFNLRSGLIHEVNHVIESLFEFLCRMCHESFPF
jgi:hypothetical protein